MRLKRVRIFGFKTFADKTDFDVDGNIVAVVGPNGCGKSNIVDAILWALGEGNPKQLRAESSQDVIFSGSRGRKPLGYAEVTLLFDNEDGALPVETSEVVVTRRLNRAGESEYQINRRPCRQRDVLELLADSGLGRAGYAIVSQKEIDHALAASPEDRRAWVDEAAGVQRYRARKQESIRRLSSAHAHLERVADILHEIESQREPLREEAEVACRYKSIQAALREMESGVLIVEVAQASRECERHAAKAADAKRLAEAEAAAAESVEAELHRSSRQIGDLEKRMDALREEQHACLAAFERAESELRLSQHKLETLDRLESSMGDERQALETRIAEAVRELEQATAEREVESRLLERVRLETAGAGAEAMQLTTEVELADKRLLGARRAQSERMRLEAENAHRMERSEEIWREIQGVEATLPELLKAASVALEGHRSIEAKTKSDESALDSLQAELRELDSEESQALGREQALGAERASLEGRRAGIQATLVTNEGLQAGARAVLEAARRGKLKGNFSPVGESIQVDRAHALAIEAALGGAAHDLIVADGVLAASAIVYLKSAREGKATFQPVSMLRGHERRPEATGLLAKRGVLGFASDFVTCDEGSRPVVESLLGEVLIVQDLDTALRLAKTTGWARLVTMEGEVVHRRGWVSGGGSANEGSGLIARKAELAEAKAQLAELETQILEESKARGARQKRRQKLQREIETAENRLEATQRELEDARRWLGSIEEELESTHKGRLRLDRELERLAPAKLPEMTEGSLADLEEQRDVVLRRLSAKAADADVADSRIAEAETRLGHATLRLEQAERRHGSSLAAEQHRQRKLTHVEPDRSRLRAEIAQTTRGRDAAAKDRERTARALQSAQEEKRAALERSFSQAETSKKARLAAQESLEAAHQAELARARADAKRANALPRLLEEYGIDEPEAIRREPEIELPADAQAVSARLRRDLRAMGDVNLGAIEAFERLSRRSDELHVQREDVLAGIAEVQSGIRELDRLTRDRFAETFARVEAAFGRVFARVFQGGEGSIRLTEPANLLETGIEIDVTLPGKKRQKLELLSGGERSLCATAFLFALLEARPSPLVVLDEVDAPLDGRNVERFVELLRDFADRSQFIVITHNATTIAAAPVWLGVTMQEPGVSTLVPARLAPESASRVVAAVVGDPEHGERAVPSTV